MREILGVATPKMIISAILTVLFLFSATWFVHIATTPTESELNQIEESNDFARIVAKTYGLN